jgi:hypothetical protein
MLRGIASLGVPYIFVSGNHDRSSPTDEALITRLSRVPNVVLLQQPGGALRELSFHGLRLTGFNDPRYFGDDNQDPTAKEAPAVDAYNAAMASQPESDLVVTHEPYAAKAVDRGRILVNGHIHTALLDGRRIQVGTFTGGGVVAHYAEGPDAELTGQPYAFDVVTFGSACTLTQLTRYSYRNLLEGRPAYDSVQVINGTTIDPEATTTPPTQQPATQQGATPAKRTCSRLEDTSIRTIPNPAAATSTTGSTGSIPTTGSTTTP